jgi:N-hydroxyarylamine O-acetyltransferase
MDVAAYLNRIGMSEPIEPDLVNLERLQRSHLTAVPFENLDVFYRRGVGTSDTWSVPKIVDRGRGGWCFELNGAFTALLMELGYTVKRLAATVLYPPISPMPTHLALEVSLDRPYLVDVGFGDSFIRPLPLDSEGPHDGGVGEFGFVSDGDRTSLVSYETDGQVEAHYRFNRPSAAVAMADFDEASSWLQTAPGMSWTQSAFATRLLDGGPDRVTLLHDRIKFKRDGEWAEESIDEMEWPNLLDKWFGMVP